ncbi:MAG: glycosyltransferase, partial [Gammaproteobacteria bacterium]|nr:glycosyltransferase [Gammaproteobacteria bacterium]
MINSLQDASLLVTVVVPVYNTERYVAETLHSLITQTYRNLEILVIIDGSTDGSLEVCQSFQDPRIRIIEQENRGLAGARNRGIEESTGELIGFLDSDDSWEPEKVERHVAQFQEDPALGVGFSYSSLMDEQSRPYGTVQKEGTDPATFVDFYVFNVMGNGSNAVIRRAVFSGREPATDFPAMQGFQTTLRRAEDYELWCRITCRTRWNVACIPETLINYRINTLGLSANLGKQRSYHFLAMARIAAMDPGLAEAWRTRAVAHAYWHQARIAATQHLARLGITAVKLALWYDWRSLNANHAMIGLALVAARLLPRGPYVRLQRVASSWWGSLQRLQVKLARGRARPGRGPDRPGPCSAAVKAPQGYARKKAAPNLFLLSHRHRFMYLGISKNASSSMKQLMWFEENEGSGEESPRNFHRYWGWAPKEGRSIDRADRASLNRYDDFVRFTVYRDPVSRFLSGYHNKVLYSPNAHAFYA